jgi:predicted secreted protein
MEKLRDQIGDYINSGFQVVGLIGIGGSPTCGVSTTLDLKKFDLLAQMNLDTLNTQNFNEFLYRELLIEGKGLFIQALEHKLKEKKIQITFNE